MITANPPASPYAIPTQGGVGIYIDNCIKISQALGYNKGTDTDYDM